MEAETVGAPIFEPLDKERHSGEDFSCEVESLQTYFRSRANQDVQRKLAAVFVLVDGPVVLGFYTLASYVIDAGELPEKAASVVSKK